MRISHNMLPQGISQQATMHQLGKVRKVYEPRHTHPLATISTLQTTPLRWDDIHSLHHKIVRAQYGRDYNSCTIQLSND